MTDTVGTDEFLGNTKTKNSTTVRARGWTLTLNNYSEEEYNDLIAMAQKHSQKYIIGKEIGQQGTPHLQGYIYFKNPNRLSTLKEFNKRIHWEKAKGSPKDNLIYCSKDGNYISKGFEEKKSFQDLIKEKLLLKYQEVKWKEWQQELLNLIEQEPDDRTIHWIVDFIGNSGKSFLTKYIALTREIIIADGKKDNIFNQVNRKLNEEQKEFQVVILDIPRSSAGYINYGVLEQLKNGLIYSGKYEGGLCLFDNVHVIIFANFEPDISQFSTDRWNIIRI